MENADCRRPSQVEVEVRFCRTCGLRYNSGMAKRSAELFTVTCPCCQGELQIDPETRAVISHKEFRKPPSIGDLETAVSRLKGEAQRREDAFQKSMAQQKDHQKVLDRKFDELLRQAKENPDEAPPKRDIDFD